MPHQDYYQQHPELVESALRYYKGMDFMGFHFTISEMLTGNELEAVEHYFHGFGEPLPFQPENCYLLVSGLPQAIYHDVYGWQVPQAYEFFLKQYKPRAEALLAAHGYAGVSIIHLFDGKKRYVTLFSPLDERAGDPIEIARGVDSFLQRRYEALLFRGSSPYVHVTALSRRITRYEDISLTFARLQSIAALAYFFPSHRVLTEDGIETLRQPFSRELATDDVRRLRDALTTGDAQAGEQAARHALLDRLLPSYSFSALHWMLPQIAEIFAYLRVTYDLAPEADEESLFDKRYPTIFALADALTAAVNRLCAAMSGVTPIRSRVVADAVHTIRAHYASRETTVSQIAAHARVTPNYLNAAFKATMGVTPGEFLAQARIEAAKRQLLETTLRVGEIAARVGIPDARYFSRFFKKRTGLTPQVYRSRSAPPA